MRKLKLEVQLSLDGFAADDKGSTDWMVWNWAAEWNWDKALQDFHTGLQTSSDAALLGRRMGKGDYYSHWQKVAQDKNSPQYEFANAIIHMKQYVFSRTLKKVTQEGFVLLNGDLKTEVSKLKRQNGKDLIVYGGTRFVSALIKEGLIDEYNLIINPTILGKGKPIYKSITKIENLDLIDATNYPCGVVVLRYKKKRS